jgi:hypothetical protein
VLQQKKKKKDWEFNKKQNRLVCYHQVKVEEEKSSGRKKVALWGVD